MELISILGFILNILSFLLSLFGILFINYFENKVIIDENISNLKLNEIRIYNFIAYNSKFTGIIILMFIISTIMIYFDNICTFFD